MQTRAKASAHAVSKNDDRLIRGQNLLGQDFNLQVTSGDVPVVHDELRGAWQAGEPQARPVAEAETLPARYP